MRTLSICSLFALVTVLSTTAAADPTPRGDRASDGPPRIMYWWGKVNQHVDLERLTWETDPDGVSGADLDPLAYCRTWYPDTVDVRPYEPATIRTWRERGNVNRHTARRMSLECVQEAPDRDPI